MVQALVARCGCDMRFLTFLVVVSGSQGTGLIYFAASAQYQ